MKVITRKVREGIVLRYQDGREVLVSVSEIRDANSVRIAIQAPRDLNIRRDEIQQEKPHERHD